MRDYSVINSSFLEEAKYKNALPNSKNKIAKVVENDENVENNDENFKTQTNMKSVIPTQSTLKKVSRKSPRKSPMKRNRSPKKSPKRKALVEMSSYSPNRQSIGRRVRLSLDPQELDVVGSKCKVEEKKDTEKNIQRTKSMRLPISERKLTTPCIERRRLNEEDGGVEATNEGYASVHKLTEWLKERPFDSCKKGTPSSTPAYYPNYAIKGEELSDTKKTLFNSNTTGTIDSAPAKPNIPKNPAKVRVLKATTPAKDTIPTTITTEQPLVSQTNRLPRKPTPHVSMKKKSRLVAALAKTNTENGGVQATNDGYASVGNLASWLENKPFQKKKEVTNVKKGQNVLLKSLVFEPGQELPKEQEFKRDIKKHHVSVSGKKDWLKHAFEEP